MKCFISYSHQDYLFVKTLSDDLIRKGFEIWLDERELRIGDSIARTIRSGIDGSDFFLLVISDRSNDSKWVQQELDVALDAEMGGTLKRVLPLLVGSTKAPSLLAGRFYADFFNGGL